MEVVEKIKLSSLRGLIPTKNWKLPKCRVICVTLTFYINSVWCKLCVSDDLKHRFGSDGICTSLAYIVGYQPVIIDGVSDKILSPNYRVY